MPYYPDPQVPETDESGSDVSELSMSSHEHPSESEKLREAFQMVCHSFLALFNGTYQDITLSGDAF